MGRKGEQGPPGTGYGSLLLWRPEHGILGGEGGFKLLWYESNSRVFWYKNFGALLGRGYKGRGGHNSRLAVKGQKKSFGSVQAAEEHRCGRNTRLARS